MIRICESRSKASAEELLGKGSAQPLVSDRYSAYSFPGPHQYCQSHWQRDIESIRSWPEAHDVYHLLLYDLGEVFLADRLYRAGRLTRRQWEQRIRYRRKLIKREIFYWAIAGPSDRLQKICHSWLRDFDKYWTFLCIEGMELTNNRCERELRPLVIRRKTSFGTRSDSGERFVERAYSLIGTLAKRGADAFEFFIESLRCYLTGLPAPLLPAPACV